MLQKSKVCWAPVILAVALGALSCRRKEEAKPALELKTDDDKAFYALGLDIGTNISVFSLQPSELELVKLGLSDAITKTTPKVELDKVRPQLMELARKRSETKAEGEKQKGQAAVESAAKEPGAERLPSGVVIKSLRPGTGASPTETDTVKVNYEGRLVDGTVFDSSYKRNEPVSFPLTGVVPCWTAGLQKMKVGEKAQLTCPSDVAYGEQGRPPSIPGGATLVFDVELLEIAGK
jgi:FKBP-type peptidyl-prolyl cis-trans isomerase FkpA